MTDTSDSVEGLAEARELLGRRMQLLRFTTAGSVDDGKSTLIGRLLVDTKQVFEDQGRVDRAADVVQHHGLCQRR